MKIGFEEKLKSLPASSGVYLMYDKAGDVIYVGKAVVLKNRVRQYFNNSVKLAKVQAMVDNVFDFGYIITLSEKDALSLESNLVKKYNPRYNILLKDDKASPYIRIDMRESFPCMEITRKIKRDGARYFGPYLAGIRVRDVLSIAKSAYKLRSCKGRLKIKKGKRATDRECLNYHIGLCYAPCCSRIDEQEYKLAAEKACAFLSGKTDEAKSLIEGKMERASANEDFERAIEYRSQLEVLKKLKDRNVADLKDGDIDSIALVSDGLYGAIAINIVRGGKMMGVRTFPAADAGLASMDTLSSFITQYYVGNEIPSEIAIYNSNDFNDIEERLSAVAEYLSTQKGSSVRVFVPQKGAKRRLVIMAERNASDYLVSSIERMKRDEDMTSGAAKRLAELLEIKTARRIECFDISHLGGTDLVASRSVFLDGVPFKSAYRRYKIRSVEGQDDYASMAEVITRRFKPSDRANEPEMPDLLVIDGGKGQLSAAMQAMQECNVNVPMISLAKRDELIFLNQKDKPLALTKNDYALRLLIRIRDEAHRFAVSYQRKTREQKLKFKTKR